MFKGSFLLIVTFIFSVFAFGMSILAYRHASVSLPVVVREVTPVAAAATATPSAVPVVTKLPVRLLTPVVTLVPKS